MSIFVAGHNGMVGAAIKRSLEHAGESIITASRNELNLLNQNEVDSFIKDHNIKVVFLAAAKVGGIHANSSFPADFLYENLMIQNNIIHSSFSHGIKKLIFLGSSCIYPKMTKQPIKEGQLLDGKLENTNEAYAIAKIAGIKLCHAYNIQYGTDYRSIMPTNLYGPGDNYNLEGSHVIPALIRKFHDAKILNKKKVICWGTGNPLREFMHVDDLASAALFIAGLDKLVYKNALQKYNISHINAGHHEEISIKNLALKISKVIGYNGSILQDESMPDGMQRKKLDNTVILDLGWSPNINLEEGLRHAYKSFKEELRSGKVRN